MSPRCTIVVLAKAPVAGYAKTRLIPALGAAGAARLAQRFLTETITQALAAELGEVQLCCAPDRHDPAFSSTVLHPHVVRTDQGDGDLGERMARALHRCLVSGGCAILVGTDTPALDARCLRLAQHALVDHDAVFVPTFDGGYALVGLGRPAPQLFDNMPWSSSRVMALTRERLVASGLRHVELEMLVDVDEPADLEHVPAAWL